MARYEIIIYWSDEDQAFIAEVPELPGCMADGKTYQEVIANAEAVMREIACPRSHGPSLHNRQSFGHEAVPLACSDSTWKAANRFN